MPKHVRDDSSAGQFVSGLLLAVALNLTVSAAHAEVTGKVVAVTDGDTIKVLVDRGQVRVRLLDIDAPEKAQAFGQKSKRSLSDLCFGKFARLDDKGKDRYGRTLATVYCEGVDANSEQVRRGMAWVYVKYASKHSPLYELETNAKTTRRGLWADNDPVPPWEWRKAKSTR